MKYIFPLIRNVISKSELTGYPLRIDSIGESQSDAIHEAIKVLGLKPVNDDYDGTEYSKVYDSFSLDLSKTIKPILEDNKCSK